MARTRDDAPKEFRSTSAVRRALKPVESGTDACVRVLLAGGQTLELPSALEGLLLMAVRDAASGHNVVLVRTDDEVSPAKAGELLGVSRQYVDRLISEGVLPARRIPGSTHRKLRVADVVAFGERRDERREVISDMVDTLTDAGAKY
jgi:excisionase family DNA binding protein